MLRVLTRFNATTYYEGPEGYTGLEYDLVRLFARHLGVTAKFIIPGTFDQILEQIAAGKADIAAAGLSVTDRRTQQMRFAPAYSTITEQVIYRSGTRRPRDPGDLAQGIVEVVKGSSHVGTLSRLKQTHPELEWNINEELDSDGLLYLVNEGLIDYTIANSNQVALIQRFFPKLNVAFDISEGRSLAWAMARSDDDSLYREVFKFFRKIERDKTLAQLLERHYGHTRSLDQVSNCAFREHVRSRLPDYLLEFQDAAVKYDVDWRLLAAMGYQESHWDRLAVSPTGVRGIMMLTQNTAKQMGIEDREDPEQSIDGGTRYFLRSKKRIPSQIPEPDRTWLALAAYNVGYGHLQDARSLTKQLGGNPDKWIDVKEHLPLLSKQQWHSQTRHGYARGREPVRYVENIRSYYDLLVWLTEENPIAKNLMQPLEMPPPVKRHIDNTLLSFETPAL